MITGKTLQMLLAINAVALITVIILLTRSSTVPPIAPAPKAAAAAPAVREPEPDLPEPAEEPVQAVAAVADPQKNQNAAIAAAAPLSPYEDPIVPMVFIEPLPEDRDIIDPAHLQMIRSDFVTALQRGPQLDPKSPEYMERWNALKDNANDEFRAQFGTDAYMKYQELARKAGVAYARLQQAPQ